MERARITYKSIKLGRLVGNQQVESKENAWISSAFQTKIPTIFKNSKNLDVNLERTSLKLIAKYL